MSEGQVVGTISIKVTPDTSKFRRELHAELAAIEKAEEAKVKVKADFDKDGLTEKVKAAAEEAGTKVKIKADVNTAFIKGKILNDLANLKAKVKVTADVDRSLLDRLRTRRGGGGGFGGGGFGGGGLGGLGSIGNFGDPANLIAIFSLLPPALAILAPALVSLPALIAGVVAPIGVLALGMNGLKQAAENAGLAVAGKKGKLGVGPALKQLQEGVSDVFAKGFTPILSQLLTVAQPATTAMRGVAQGIVNIAQGVTNTLTSPAIVNQLNTLFSNIAGGLSAAAPGFSSFTTGLINLATQVSNHFPGLADWFNKLGERFSGWVSKISKDGSLDKAISSMRPVMDEIIGFIGRLVDAGIKLAADPKMGESIKGVLDGISNFIINALPDLTNFFNAIAPLVKLLGKLPPGQNDALNPNGTPHTPFSFLDGGSGVPGKPLILPEAQHNLKNLLSFANPATMIADLFDSDSAVATVGAKIGDILSKSFELAKQGLATSASGIWDGITQSAQLALSGLSTIWDGVKSAASSAWGNITSTVSGAVSGIVGFVQGLPGQIAGIWDSIVSAARNAWNQLVSAAQSAVSQVVGVFAALPGQIIGILSNLGGALFSAGANAMGRLADGVRSAVGKVTGAVSGALGGILSMIPHSPAPEGPFSSPGWNALFTGGQAIGNQFQTGLENGFQGVIQSATDLLNQVHAALSQGVLPPGLKQNLQSELKAIGTEYDQLKVQRDLLNPNDKSGRKAITDQMRQLQTLRDQLKLERDKFPGKTSTSKQDMNIGQMFGQQLQKLPSLGTNFAMANVNQFEQDLGISGKGAIPTIANIGVQWGTSLLSNMIGQGFGNQGLKGGDTHIYVNSLDEAMAAKQNEQNRKAMTYAGR